jgi:cyanophycin synthetase
LWTNPFVLKGLYAMAMARAFRRYRNPRRRAAGRNQDEFYLRTWRQAAEAVGGTFRATGACMGEIELDGVLTRVSENYSEIDGPVTLAMLHDKPLCHRVLREHGLPVPRHATFSIDDIRPAFAFLETLGAERDCVVKPACGTGGGRGVTTGIRSPSQLARAAAAAAVYADRLLIEEQIAGDNYRLLYLDGVMIDAFARRLPCVVGDGRSSVANLVEAHNTARLDSGTGMSQVLLTVDYDMKRTLARQGLSLRSVPAAGRSVTLKTAVNENCGSDNTTATKMLCPAIVEAGARAARALRARFVGIDILTTDPRVGLAESGGVILEINGTPNLYFHYTKRDGTFPVAVHLLRRLLCEDAHGGGAADSTRAGPVLQEEAVGAV